MIRLGLSGTNWTRKTTSIAGLLPRLAPASVDSVSLSKLVAQSPHPMRENQTVDASRWMIAQVRTVIGSGRTFDCQVFDRTPLDIMAFTRYAIDRAQAIDASSVLDDVLELSAAFDLIFFCRPQGEWPSPVTPTEDLKQFALLIDGLMESSVSMMRAPVVTLPWDAGERLKIILDSLREYRAGSGKA
jgi:hypothetical protein